MEVAHSEELVVHSGDSLDHTLARGDDRDS